MLKIWPKKAPYLGHYGKQNLMLNMFMVERVTSTPFTFLVLE